MWGIRKLCPLAAVVVALLPAGTAGATEVFGVTPAGEVAASSLGPVTFTAGGYVIRCNVTLTGSIDDGPLQTIVGEQAGSITGASIAGCTNGALTAVLGFPWRIEYAGFTGVLPAITSLSFTLNRISAEFNVAGLFTCLYSGAITTRLALTGTNPSRTGLLTLDEARTFAKVSGSEFCPTSGRISGTYAFTPQTVVVNPRVIVSVGDSYISGEAGRWAGNTATMASATIDALGPTAYWDKSLGSAERVPGCHRSRAAEVFIGGTVEGTNLACSGARVESRTEGGFWKPGLDFEDRGPERKGQALELKLIAGDWRRAIKVVVISIGGNDFRFAWVVEQCVIAFRFGFGRTCSQLAEVRRVFEANEVANVKAKIRQGITNVDRAMREAGLTATDYRLLVQTYPSPLPDEGTRFRYVPNMTRESTGGCPITDADASWANVIALRTMNRAVEEAAASLNLPNLTTMDLSTAFDGRRLCENTVWLLEEAQLNEWRATGAVDRTEWINRIRTADSGPFSRNESLHINYWGELALRNCLRQAYNNGGIHGGRCTIAGIGLNEMTPREPRMRLD